jgi:hypothetical protein
VKLILNSRQRRRIFSLGLEIDRKRSVGRFDFSESDTDSRSQPLLGIGARGADSESELVDVGFVEPHGLEFRKKGGCPTRSLDQRLPDVGYIEIKTIEDAGCLEVPKLDFELDSCIKQPGTMGTLGLSREAFSEPNKIGEIDIAPEYWSPIDNRNNFFHGLSLDRLGVGQVAGNQQDQKS